MNLKTQRFAAIRRIIRSEMISSQEDLIARLHASGIEITQSTLSRDLKYLNVAKIPHKTRGYVYVLPNMTNHDTAISPNVGDNIIGLTYSGNMGVLRTKSGYASAVSVPIDNLECPMILGTIAGDNTVLLILTEDANRNHITEVLLHLFPALSNVLFNEYGIEIEPEEENENAEQADSEKQSEDQSAGECEGESECDNEIQNADQGE